MRVLIATPYFYDPSHKEFTSTSSGFGYMVKDILDAVAKHDDIFVFTHQFTDGYKDNYSVVKHNKLDVVKRLRLRDLISGIRDAIRNNEDINTRLHYLYYQINKGAFIRTICELNPEVVHIHGLTYQTKPFVEACNELKIKYIVTLHGLNGINETVILPDVEKIYEKDALTELNKNGIPVTVISTGILKKIKIIYKIDISNIRVILNGTNLQPHHFTGINREKFEIVCIGSISFHKNQTQLIDSIINLDENYKKNMHISFFGTDSDNINLGKYIKDSGLEDIAEYKGFVPRNQLANVWKKADLNVVMSKEEGFGLSIIEGFMYGVPTASFSDLDAIADLYNEEAIVLFKSRNCEDVQAGIIQCMHRKFNREKIIKWGMKFSMDAAGKNYSDLYRAVLRGHQ